MQAIPTIYDGVFYRSRTEARWATVLQHIGVESQYELEGFSFEIEGTLRVQYLPDFYLQRWNLWAEVKPTAPTRQQWAVHRAFLAHQNIIFICGTPRYSARVDKFDYELLRWDVDRKGPVSYRLATCGRCGAVSICPSDWYPTNGARSSSKPLATSCECIHQRVARFRDQKLTAAYFYANSHKFGERAPMMIR